MNKQSTPNQYIYCLRLTTEKNVLDLYNVNFTLKDYIFLFVTIASIVLSFETLQLDSLKKIDNIKNVLELKYKTRRVKLQKRTRRVS